MLTLRKTSHRNLVVFVHIPKTAGTTLYSILAQQYSAEEAYKINFNGSSKQIRRLKRALKQRHNPLHLIFGHIDFLWAKLLPRDALFFTLLRDPVERVVSHYYQYRRATTTPIHQMAMQSSLQQWVSSRGLAEMDNGMTRRLSGEMDLPIGGVTSQTLDRAKANLADNFAVVGLTERFEESQILLHRAFNWPLYRYPARNVGDNRLRRSELSQEEIDTIEKFNRFDVALYQFATELFEQATSKFDMPRELALLRAAPEYSGPVRHEQNPTLSTYHRGLAVLQSLMPKSLSKKYWS